MAAVGLFSERDADIMRQLLEDYKKGLINFPSRPSAEQAWAEAEDHQAPEVYLGRPSSAITGLTPGATAVDDVPGTGTITLYRLLITDDPTAPEIISTGRTLRVYNFSEEDFAADWMIVFRDKFGAWLIGGGTIVCP